MSKNIPSSTTSSIIKTLIDKVFDHKLSTKDVCIRLGALAAFGLASYGGYRWIDDYFTGDDSVSDVVEITES